MAPETGQLIAGKYRLLRPLARGGMGSVWVAEHVELGVDVAVKFSTVAQALDPQAESRFKREARAAALLKSPHVVQIHDYGLDAGTPYIAMELLEGEDLSEHLARAGRLSPARALELVKQAGKALTRAHEHGVVHRDIKPSNLFLARHGQDETLKVLDFGIAKEQTAEPDSQTTSAGMVVGSPAYMSPEQARAGVVDQRSDVYSLAAILFRMLTGVAPFSAENPQALLIKLCTDPLPRASELCPDLTPEFDVFFERALTRNVARRFASVNALIEAFEPLALSTPRVPSARIPAASSSAAPAVGRASVTESLVAPAPIAKASRAARFLVPVALGALLLSLLIWRAITPSHAAAERAVQQAPAHDQRAAVAPVAVASEPAATPHMPLPVRPKAPPPSAKPTQMAPKSAQSAATATPAPTQESTAAKDPVSVLDPVFGILVPAPKAER